MLFAAMEQWTLTMSSYILANINSPNIEALTLDHVGELLSPNS
jgi:hypothetical protein